jgi:hypothetical protein
VGQPHGNAGNHGNEDGLPLRWALILFISAGIGIATGVFGGIAAGLPAGLMTTAMLNEIIK